VFCPPRNRHLRCDGVEVEILLFADLFELFDVQVHHDERRVAVPEAAYRRACRTREVSLGWTQIVEVGYRVWVANLYAQHGIRCDRNARPLRDDRLAECLNGLGVMAYIRRASVHMPRIGCGLAGGRWEEVEPIIRETLCAAGVPVFVYDLPGKGG
jgi:hypothetical protein